MNILNRITELLRRNKSEPLQSDEARVMENGRVLDDHPSNKISPAKLKSILEDAENGDITAQHQLFMDIEEQDTAIGSNIATRKRAVLTLGWKIYAPRNATPAEEKLKEEVDELFHQIGYLDDLVIDCMDAVGHGFSALEIMWELRNGHYFPAKFIHRPPSWFKLDKQDNLLLLTPDNPQGVELTPMKWVVHTHKNRSVQLARNGLYRTLAWLYMFKHYSVFDFAEFLELYGLPIRIGKYGAGATDKEKKSLLRALADIGHNAAGIMPESMQIELHDVADQSGGGEPFLKMINWCEKSIARLILGQTLTSDADSKTATNALGQIHNEVRRDLLVSDAKQLSQTFTQQIILPYLLINFPNVDPMRIPYFEFDTKETADIKTFAEALPPLVQVGLPIPQQWALDKLGIPVADEDEPVLKAVQNEVKTDLNAEKLSANLHTEGCSCSGCRGVALKGNLNSSDEQTLLDGMLNQALNIPDFNQQLDPIVQKAVAVLNSCNSYEEASEKLAEIYPDLNSEQHHSYLSNALFLADLLGVSSGQR
ncbi:hypothetical protein BMT54_01320 [Pasteurellaceae bacterium 15-036681]|nr:hypothetical protein BMT54_01320 [Pasteurellaceae bacterium 15-036681]